MEKQNNQQKKKKKKTPGAERDKAGELQYQDSGENRREGWPRPENRDMVKVS